MKTFALAVTLFFVIDPVGNLPVMLGLLSRLDNRRRRVVVAREQLIALLCLVLAYAIGPWCMRMLDLGPSDLRICGGVVLGIIALKMVFPGENGTSVREGEAEPFIVPLAIPLMAGPSAIATVLVMSAQYTASPISGLMMVILGWLGAAVLLFFGVMAGRLIPNRLLTALERLTGLLLAVMAVRMLMLGVQQYFLANAK